ncbi:MAG: anthranilate synthase component I family protein [Fuerstiella sp.]|nr:anthranilate synthase component I family protein [Fuerstiella sp.]
MSNSLHIHNLPRDLDVVDTVRRFADQSFLVVFDSAVPGQHQDARYTILTADPVEVCRLDRCDHGDTPFEKLREWTTRLPVVDREIAPPFCGGVAGLMSYELGHAFEVLPRASVDEFSTPALAAGLFDWAIVWDHAENSVQLCVLQLAGLAAPDTIQRQRTEWILARLAAGREGVVASHVRGARCDLSEKYPLEGRPAVSSGFSETQYVAAVERVIEYIRAGDIFQANLSQQLTTSWLKSVFDLYCRVKQHNPAPFCGLFQYDEFAVVSASPERFLKVSEGRFVESRPIKGTRRRHRSPIADLFTGNALYASEKDRAENVMIVDLLRNDLSRVCRPGSVKVTGLCEIEVFETVQHLVSTIVGELQPGLDVWHLCAAAIPGGSITGAPKIRAMEIIAELEPTARGAYCGNMFYFGPNGDFDSSILIRTFTVKDGVVQFPVGGGIVADSDPEDEYRETLHKAAGMLQSVGMGGLSS